MKKTWEAQPGEMGVRITWKIRGGKEGIYWSRPRCAQDVVNLLKGLQSVKEVRRARLRVRKPDEDVEDTRGTEKRSRRSDRGG